MDNVMIGAEIAQMNDVFRRSGLGVTLTRGAAGLPDVNGLMRGVREFSDFSEDNDPYGEHDMGKLMWFGQKGFWKIDYYNQGLSCYEDPFSPTCRRVMSVMLAEEY